MFRTSRLADAGMWLLAAAPLLGAPDAVIAQVCDTTPEIHAVRILGTDAGGALTDLALPHLAGDQSFYQRLDTHTNARAMPWT